MVLGFLCNIPKFEVNVFVCFSDAPKWVKGSKSYSLREEREKFVSLSDMTIWVC
jgi:hypothetical protein